ncbi:hypothetical protein [Bradyrhizobium sp. LB11.1]|uniref:hypothetical protein n=1 Tax=Bradyrhizobium sp. LB11.1 TaxID=3156326 RepID=UPI003391D46C
MKMFFAALALLVCANSANAADCKSIADATARLNCFDREAAPKPNAQKLPPTPSTAKGKDVAAIDGGWELRVIKDGFSSKTSCVISPTGKPWIQMSPGQLYISYHGRGGVEGFTVRMDEYPPEEMQLPTPIDKSIGMVHFKGSEFSRLMTANRLRVQTFTVLRELKNEDMNLAGAKRLYKKMPPECG